MGKNIYKFLNTVIDARNEVKHNFKTCLFEIDLTRCFPFHLNNQFCVNEHIYKCIPMLCYALYMYDDAHILLYSNFSIDIM